MRLIARVVRSSWRWMLDRQLVLGVEVGLRRRHVRRLDDAEALRQLALADRERHAVARRGRPSVRGSALPSAGRSPRSSWPAHDACPKRSGSSPPERGRGAPSPAAGRRPCGWRSAGRLVVARVFERQADRFLRRGDEPVGDDDAVRRVLTDVEVGAHRFAVGGLLREVSAGADGRGSSSMPATSSPKSTPGRTRVVSRGAKRCGSPSGTPPASARRGERSSRIQIERPWVPAMRSLSLIRRSWIGATGRLSWKRCQWAPSSNET